MKTCQYGCGLEARYNLKNGKLCCSESFMKCKEVRRKNSNGLAKAWKDGRLKHKYSEKMNWSRNPDSRGFKNRVEKIKKEVLIKNSFFSSEKVRHDLITFLQWPEKCSICGLTEWLVKPITLDLDHIDGDNRNNTIENLRFLCPNCHRQTNTFSGKNKNSGRKKVEDDVFIRALKSSRSIRQALLKCGLAPKGENYHRARELLETMAE